MRDSSAFIVFYFMNSWFRNIVNIYYMYANSEWINTHLWKNNKTSQCWCLQVSKELASVYSSLKNDASFSIPISFNKQVQISFVWLKISDT